MKRTLFLLPLLLLANSLFAQEDRSVIKSYRTDKQPTFDGKISPGEWDAAGPWITVTADSPKAQLGDDMTDTDNYGGITDGSYRFKTMWQQDTFKFYVLYEVFDDIAATAEPRENRLWERDQVETFLDGTDVNGQDDSNSFHWWDNPETYGKLGVNRSNLFEGNSGKMTDDLALWNEYDSSNPKLSVSAVGDTGVNDNYVVELGITLEPMWEDSVNAPFDGTATQTQGHIVEGTTKIKFTNALSDDDDFDHEFTDRSSTLTYYREKDGQIGMWDQSSYFADLQFVGKYVASVVGDCNGDGVLNVADLSCQTAATLSSTLATLKILPGDFDGNRAVEFSDFLVLSSNFGKSGANYTMGDADGNTNIEFADFLLLSSNFGKQSGAVAAAVPEPSMALMGLSLLFSWLGYRRRRG